MLWPSAREYLCNDVFRGIEYRISVSNIGSIKGPAPDSQLWRTVALRQDTTERWDRAATKRMKI